MREFGKYPTPARLPVPGDQNGLKILQTQGKTERNNNMKYIDLQMIANFVNSDDAKNVTIDFIKPIYSPNETENNFNISIVGEISEETKEMLSEIKREPKFEKIFANMFKIAKDFKDKQITIIAPLGNCYYKVRNSSGNEGVCNMQGNILWIERKDNADFFLPLYSIEMDADKIENDIARMNFYNTIIGSWFDLYEAGYNDGWKDNNND